MNLPLVSIFLAIFLSFFHLQHVILYSINDIKRKKYTYPVIQVKEGFDPNLAYRMKVLEKYMTLKILIVRESRLMSILHTYLAKRAKLKLTESLNPRPPSDLP